MKSQSLIFAIIFFSNCTTIKLPNKLNKEKDLFLYWRIKNEKPEYKISRTFTAIPDLSFLQLQYRKKSNTGRTAGFLKYPFTKQDSVLIIGQINNSRKEVTLQLPEGKEYYNGNYADDIKTKRVSLLCFSDPVYFPKEKGYVIFVEYKCGFDCYRTALEYYDVNNGKYQLVFWVPVGIS